MSNANNTSTTNELKGSTKLIHKSGFSVLFLSKTKQYINKNEKWKRDSVSKMQLAVLEHRRF